MSSSKEVDEVKYDTEGNGSINTASEKGYARKALKLGGSQLALLAFSTLGVIYSDIG
jgi:hypothetical protein